MKSIAEILEDFKQMSSSLKAALDKFIAPFASILPDARYRKTLHQFVPAILAARSPQPARAAAYAPDPPANTWALAKRFFSLLHTPSFSHQDWLGVFYTDARQVVETMDAPYVLVALDTVNFEKPYARKMEGISKIRKATPPGSLPRQAPRITWGYPAIFGFILNAPQPAIVYHHLFSYTSPDFISQPMEWMKAFQTIRQVLSDWKVCVVADAEADDKKLWQGARECKLEFIFRAASVRHIRVWNERLHRWEDEELQSLSEVMAGRYTFRVEFNHAGRKIPARVTLDWFRFRLPDEGRSHWAVVAETVVMKEDVPEDVWLPPRHLVLVTNRPVRGKRAAQRVYEDWCQRGRIEPFYRFIQEDGVEVERFLVRRLERIRRMVLLVLMGALFILRLESLWPEVMIQWIRRLASSTGGTELDRGGPYLLLEGVRRVLGTFSLLQWMAKVPPPIPALPGPT